MPFLLTHCLSFQCVLHNSHHESLSKFSLLQTFSLALKFLEKGNSLNQRTAVTLMPVLAAAVKPLTQGGALSQWLWLQGGSYAAIGALPCAMPCVGCRVSSFLSIALSLSLLLSIYLSLYVYLYVYMSGCLYISAFLFLSVYVSFYLPVRLSLYLFISLYLSISLSCTPCGVCLLPSFFLSVSLILSGCPWLSLPVTARLCLSPTLQPLNLLSLCLSVVYSCWRMIAALHRSVTCPRCMYCNITINRLAE